MDLDDLEKLVERLRNEGTPGDAEVVVPCGTGGFYSPYGADVDPDDQRVYIQ